MKLPLVIFVAGLLVSSACKRFYTVPESVNSNDGGADTATDASDIWRPAPGTTWQVQFTGTVDTSVDVEMYDIDLFDSTENLIDVLHADGRTVVCYISAGSVEDWRPDVDDFPPDAIGNDYQGWPGEKWLDIRHQGVRDVMLARLDLAKSRGCDGVEPDNVTGYLENTGFPLTYDDQIEFNIFLANQCHKRGLSVGLKNDVEQVQDLLSYFDWALSEECFEWGECDMLGPFIQSGKAVFHTEYDQLLYDGVCSDPSTDGFSTLIKTRELDAWFMTCP